MRYTFDPRLEDDIRSLVGQRPVLLNDVVSGLRGGWSNPGPGPASGRRWRGLNSFAIEGWLRERGYHFGCREHGSGLAIYVAAVPFNTVIEGRRGATVPVDAY